MATVPRPSHNFGVSIAEDPGDGTAPDSGDYVSMRAWASSFKLEGGERSTSQTFVTAQDSPVVMTGKRAALTGTLSLIYTSNTVADKEDYDQLRDWSDNQTSIWIKYLPENSVTTRYFVAGPGYLTNVPPPQGDASSADPLRVDIPFIMRADTYTYPAS